MSPTQLSEARGRKQRGGGKWGVKRRSDLRRRKRNQKTGRRQAGKEKTGCGGSKPLHVLQVLSVKADILWGVSVEKIITTCGTFLHKSYIAYLRKLLCSGRGNT